MGLALESGRFPARSDHESRLTLAAAWTSLTFCPDTYKNLIQGGNAATRLEAFVVKGGTFAYGSYPDIDALFKEQAADLDQKRRGATLARMQQLVHERAIYAPIWQLGFINGYGPRVGESGFGLIPSFAYTGPHEDITIKGG